MKKFVLTLVLAGFACAGIATPALACEGGKCQMEHAAKDGKTKKGKITAAKGESCAMIPAAVTTYGSSPAAATKSCCAKKDAPKAEAAKETKAQR
jgi:hypothetical protein